MSKIVGKQVRASMPRRSGSRMRNGRPYLSEQVYAKSGDLQSRYRIVASGPLQQHLGAQGKLSSLVRFCTARRAHLRKRRQRLQIHVSNEVTHLRVRLFTSPSLR